MNDVENTFLNIDEAKAFINSIVDPVDREVLWMAFSAVTFRMAPRGPSGQFDMLFFSRVLAEIIKDRDRLLKVLSGQLSED